MKPSFPLFFEALRGYPPFPWQTALADRLLGGDWPETLSLPTSAGKSSILEILVWGLAAEADLPLGERRFPRRIVYVIDRRLVVDQVTEGAVQMAARLRQSLVENGHPALRAVAMKLRRLTAAADASLGRESDPLRVVSLRGGMYKSDMWATRPDQALIVVSTVDQVGSRLLFRGYGVPERRAPIHAALLGCDSIFVVDEAHLVEPFCQTLRTVMAYQGDAGRSVAPPLKLLSMTATPRSGGSAFLLSDQDHRHPLLGQRLAASKPARLLEEQDLPAGLTREAEQLAVDEALHVIGVIANRVDTARAVFETLRSKHGPESAVLLTGRIRPVERDKLLRHWLPYMQARTDRPLPPGPGARLFVIATQTVEVGADLDFDGLITELAPLSALRQRFGRLNRLGQRDRASGAILTSRGKQEDDPLYGGDLVSAWEWLLQASAEGAAPRLVDMGLDSMADLLRRVPPPPEAERPQALLLPAHMGLLVQTAPVPACSPDVAPYLHGLRTRPELEVQVVWRADLDEADPARWEDIVQVVPPTVREAVQVPIWAVRRWLQMAEGSGMVTDQSGGVPDLVGSGRANRPALRWLGAGRSSVSSPDGIRPGDTLVVPAGYGGLDAWGWNPGSSQPVADVGDLCAADAEAAKVYGRRQLRLRVHPGLFDLSDSPENAARLTELRDLLSHDELPREAIEELVRALLAGYPGDPLLGELARKHLDQMVLNWYPDRSGVVALFPLQAGAIFTDVPDVLEPGTDDDDEERELEGHIEQVAGRTSPSPPVTLVVHQEGVSQLAAALAEGCGLSADLAETLRVAGAVHDLGKVDPRFQLILHLGNELALARATEPLAKSAQRLPRERERVISRLSAYPSGSRHEATSAALLLRHPAILSQTPEADLIPVLVGTHHGWGRPLLPAVEDPTPVDLSVRLGDEMLEFSSDHGLARIDSEWVERFFSAMERCGPWGLAYLETILRLADHLQSGLEQERRGAG